MLKNLLKYLTALVIMLHCIGATQLASAYAKDKSSFVSMVTMSEEETKKEKESCDEDDADFWNDVRCKLQLRNTYLSSAIMHSYMHDTLNRLFYQFVLESPTPPPDFLA
ncbi:MAG TPA: hypothetical protein VK174_09480 [Chitinophagales bacterium]|nr:hypothetical protein [Chitinophagales bacterium]